MFRQNSCGAAIKQLNDELEKNANNELRSQGLTMTQCYTLLILDDAPDGQLPLKELEHTMHVAQSTAAGIVARLEQKKLVEGFVSPEDRRVKMVRITPQGVACCREAEHHMDQTETQLLSGLTEAERTIFLTLLQKVRDTL